jgi:hypothetical protein
MHHPQTLYFNGIQMMRRVILAQIEIIAKFIIKMVVLGMLFQV